VAGTVSIGSVSSFDGLENLHAAGMLVVNALVVDFSPLGGLRSLGGLEIEANPNLRSISGLSGLTRPDQMTMIQLLNNPARESLMGLEAVTSVTGSVTIEGNPSLTTLAGLGNLTNIGGDLTIIPYATISNASLASASGLDSLTTVGGSVDISDNGSLTTLGLG